MNVLTQRIGPLPAWVWGGIAAVGVWYFLLRGKTTSATSASTPNAAASGSQLASGYGLGFAQGQQAAQASQAPASVTPAGLPTLNWHFGPPTSQNWVWRLTPSGQAAWQRQTGSPANFALQPSNSPPPPWLPQYSYQIAEIPPGATLQQYLDAAIQGGVGGPGTSRKHASGSRSAALWHDAHPLIGAKVLYPHYVSAVGGPANHGREVARVARQAGVHPARVLMLNPTPTGRIRIA